MIIFKISEQFKSTRICIFLKSKTQISSDLNIHERSLSWSKVNVYPGAQTTSFLGHFETMDMTSPRANSRAGAQNLRSQEPDGYFLIGSILEDETKTSNLETFWTEIRHVPRKNYPKKIKTHLELILTIPYEKVKKIQRKGDRFFERVGLCITMSLKVADGLRMGKWIFDKITARGMHLQMATRNWEIIH